MIPRFKAALFDMDGTMIHSMRYWRVSALEFMLANDVFPTEEQLSRLFHTAGRKLIAEAFAARGREISEEELIHGEERVMAHHYREDVKPKADIEAYLRYLRDGGTRLAVATASPQDLAQTVLRRLGLYDFFEFVADGYAYSISKSEPEYFELMASRLGVTPGELCVYEDSLYAVRSAKQAGCYVVAIADLMHEDHREELMREADCFIEGYRELLPSIEY